MIPFNRCCKSLSIILLLLAWYLEAPAGVTSLEHSKPVGNATVPLDRVKRLISFPINGGVAKIILGFLAPVRFHHPLPRSLNLGINVQANYAISPNIIFPRPESIFGNRALEQYTDPYSRQQLYSVLEKILQLMMLGTVRRARECLLRTVCEVADTPLHHNGLVGELLDVIFTPQESDILPSEYLLARRYGANGVDCMRVYSSCPWGMVHFKTLHAIVLSFLLLTSLLNVNASDALQCPANRVLSQRSKRWILNYPINGGVAKMVLGFLAPVRFHHPLPRSLNLSLNVQANYRILPNIIYPRPESIFKNRANSEYTDTSRKQFYELVERMLTSWNRNGRSCLLRTICEVAEAPLRHNGMIGELFEVVFTPHETDQLNSEYMVARKYGENGVDCRRLYADCPLGHGLLDAISVTDI
uniref:Uncharacterized protein n=1 Tax=Anopheles christyi TaxID=43041 RepID=A0A182KGP0_9DIPT